MPVALSLSVPEFEAIQTQQHALLTARLDVEKPVLQILVAIADLAGANRCMAFATIGGQPLSVRHNVGTQIDTYIAQHFKGFDAAGNVCFGDPALEEINRRRREMGAGIHHEGRLQLREKITQTRYFKDAFAPAGMHHVIGMTTPLQLGEAVFAFGFKGDDDPGFVGDRSSNLLRLLLPAFTAGFKRADRRAYVAADTDVAIKNIPDMQLLHHTPGPPPQSAGIMPGPSLPGRDRTWIVMPRNFRENTGDLQKAAKSFGLTDRQIEVMQFMLQGMTSPQIAAALQISPHTARRHGEAVLKRLGIRSRSAIWSVLNGHGQK